MLASGLCVGVGEFVSVSALVGICIREAINTKRICTFIHFLQGPRGVVGGNLLAAVVLRIVCF